MHEPTQDSEEANTSGEVTNETQSDQVEGQAEPVSGDQEIETSVDEQEQEVDPWDALQLELAKWKDQAIRNAAELDNFRKRMSREKLDAVRYGNQSLLEELLPVLDNFDMGMQAAAQEEGSMLFMGMQMVHKQIEEFLGSQNVVEIKADAGGEFDPKIHEALSQDSSDTVDEGNILRVVRKGYQIGERLLRPSNVIISLGAQASETPSNDK